MANFYNDKDGKKIKGTSKADKIENSGNNVSINAGAGNDHIQNSGNNVTISGGKGNDYLQNDWNAGTVYIYTEGNDTINYFNEMDNLVIANAKWTSQRTDNTVTVTVEGKGTITMNCDTAWGSQVNIVDDLSKVKSYMNINNDTDRKTVKGTAANDNIYNAGNNVSINAGNGFNRISNGEWYNDAQGALRGHRTTITSGKNDDVIWNAADYVLINTGNGDDFIYNDGANVKFVYSGGNDTITGFNATSTLQIASGTISSVMSNGEDYLIKIGKNILRLNGAAQLSEVNIINSKGKAIKFTVSDVNTITNKKNSRTLTGTADRDKITNSGKKVSVYGAGGDDTLSNSGATSTLNAGDGNDSISNTGTQVSINADAGNDSIPSWGENATIRGGAGNDMLWGSDGADKFIYSADDGDDIIYGFDDNDTLTLDNLNFNASYKNNAVTLNFNSGSITLKDFSATTFHIDKNTYKISGSKLVKQ